MDIILASTSPYRRSLLERLQIPFDCISPQVDESPLENEHSEALCERLALAKAKAVATRHPEAIVIGSDQTANCEGRLLGKPGNFEAAYAQLTQCAGKTVEFHTGLAVINKAKSIERVHREPFRVAFRALSAPEIKRYLEAEEPFDCAGSFKAEGLGISLFSELRGPDPTALEGLPLIALGNILRELGHNIP